ncbi:hypothetical protein [Nostoc sp. C117]|uniref:phosphoribosyltransferase-like protein n=1 Tax=Nostoc sp. C117 TaxID=3349875 RepID=UPI00370D0A4E
MKDELAERLLAEVMEWTSENVANERPSLQAMAAYKYDQYQQFSTGRKFVESLALWLKQFSKNERKIAYEFVKKRLIFCSSAEMEHLVAIAYPDFIRPILLDYTAKESGIPKNYISRLADSQEFKVLRRQCLFLGLSDGAHTDIFRRSNRELSHEQIWQAYEISPEKAKDMIKNLSEDMESILGRKPTEYESCFRMVFLLDDFSASGLSYLRKNPETKEFKGKINKVYKQFYEAASNLNNGIEKLFNKNELHIHLVLYMATQQACSHLDSIVADLFSEKSIKCNITVIQPLSTGVPLQQMDDSLFLELIEKDIYYDAKVKTKHMNVGKGDGRRGFNDCSLPLVLSHNTPNIPLLSLSGYSK